MLTLIALSITAAAAIAYAVRCRREVTRLRDEATEARFVRAFEVHAHGAQAREDAATIYRLTVALDEARRLLSDKRCHGRIDATRGAWEAERDRLMEATR